MKTQNSVYQKTEYYENVNILDSLCYTLISQPSENSCKGLS